METMTRAVPLTCLLALTAGVLFAQPPAPAPAAGAPAPQAPASPPGPGRGGGRGGPQVVSPQIEADGRVTFRIFAPQATTVTVGGDVGGGSLVPPPSGGSPAAAPAAPGGDGSGAAVRPRLSKYLK